MGRIEKRKNKKNNLSMLVIIILILILICSFVLFFQIKEYRKYQTKTEGFYYFFTSTKLDFFAKLTFNSKNKIILVENDKYEIDGYPIYYQKEDKMILTSNMEIVYPLKDKPLYKIGKYSEINHSGKYIYINSEYGFDRLYDCFLFNGEGLYVFVEPITIVIDQNKYQLSPMSYAEVGYETVSFYNYEKDEYVYVNNVSTAVHAYTEEYMINLSTDMYEYKDVVYSLIKNVEALNPVEF